jgi:uncharacterized membrane protein YczE
MDEPRSGTGRNGAFARLWRPLGTASWWRQFAQLQLGLLLFGVGIALLLEAHIGLDPWSCLHEGLSIRTGQSFGRMAQSVGLVFIVASWAGLRVAPGVGTVFNMAVIGPWVDLFRAQPFWPRWDGGLPGTAQFLVGLLVMGTASGLYIGARLGAGPRDSFVLGLSRRLGASIRVVRIFLELCVLGCGFLLGGPVGLGTVLFALLMGPLMQLSLRLFRFELPPVSGARTG